MPDNPNVVRVLRSFDGIAQGQEYKPRSSAKAAVWRKHGEDSGGVRRQGCFLAAGIIRFAGCGVFSAQGSHVVVDRASREMVALVLGSRVSPVSGHITQICVHPNFRRHGLARMLLNLVAACFLRQGVSEISLTVTEANSDAIGLYRAEGYECAHKFDAAVWQRGKVT